MKSKSKGVPIRVEMTSSDGSILCSLRSYKKIPIGMKLELISEMSEEYQAIGFMVAGIDRKFMIDNCPKEYLVAAKRCGMK